MKDCMLDIETLGNNTNPVITQISAVQFDLVSGKIGETFNILIDPMSCIKIGNKISQSTMEFWSEQDKEVFRKVVLESFLTGKEIQQGLQELNLFLKNNNTESVWGNGIMADNVWLETTYENCNILPQWKFFQHRDVRTIVDLASRLGSPNYKKDNEFIGERHNAIDDCKFQIKYCSDYYKYIKGNL